jgi:TctA family transporter
MLMQEKMLAQVAFKFGPAEYFSLMVLGMIGAVVLASSSLPKAIAMICLGLLGGMVGNDVNSGVSRYAFDIPELSDAIGFVSVAMGVLGFAEVITNLEQKGHREVLPARSPPCPDQERFQAHDRSRRYGADAGNWECCCSDYLIKFFPEM